MKLRSAAADEGVGVRPERPEFLYHFCKQMNLGETTNLKEGKLFNEWRRPFADPPLP
jgi:hypothetical protein